MDFTPDCKNCAALCCMALAFDKGEMFAFDKAAGQACQHLCGDHTCGIHAKLGDIGMQGCIAYSCDGAGQRVTQEVFHGASWQDDPAVRLRMIDAFNAMRLVQKNLLLLGATKPLPLNGAQRAVRVRLQKALTPAKGWTEDSLKRLHTDGTLTKLAAFFKSLRDIAPRDP